MARSILYWRAIPLKVLAIDQLSPSLVSDLRSLDFAATVQDCSILHRF
jgi:hypothetical protein